MPVPPPSVVFILALSSDIGAAMARHYLGQGATILGTYRTELPADLQANPRVRACACDLAEPATTSVLSDFLRAAAEPWDVFISCVGQLSPVGKFLQVDFDQWETAVQVNSTAQLRALHAAYPFRRTGGEVGVVFFAGGGTNSPFTSYSAYCLGKIALIKMCELLDDEAPDLNAFIVGTGWVRTKIHAQTLDAGLAAGANLTTTQRFFAEGQIGTSYADIAAVIDWGCSQGRSVTGGRNFSVVHDAWRHGGQALSAALRSDPHHYKLRRHGNSFAPSNAPSAAPANSVIPSA
jgi:NAD(P)-dependent dehydrogenase (short-subunit alcohol dehydrogenase family)